MLKEQLCFSQLFSPISFSIQQGEEAFSPRATHAKRK